MRRTACAMFFVGLVLLPALPVSAKPLDATTTDQNAAAISWFGTLLQKLPVLLNWFNRANTWFVKTLGVNLYNLVHKIADFVLLLVRIVIDILTQTLPKIRMLLSGQ